MIWTKQLAAAAKAVATEAAPPWYAEHIEAALKRNAATLAKAPVGRILTPAARAALHELRMGLDPYKVRPSHEAFRRAWAETQALAA